MDKDIERLMELGDLASTELKKQAKARALVQISALLSDERFDDARKVAEVLGVVSAS